VAAPGKTKYRYRMRAPFVEPDWGSVEATEKMAGENGPKSSPPTMVDVATKAGVSKSTVSRAFTQPGMLGAETVARILEIADRIGYIPNHTARALSTGRHSNVALVVPDVANPFFPPLIRAAQMEADRSDFCVFLGSSDESWRQEDKLVDRFVSQVEGLLLVAPRSASGRRSRTSPSWGTNISFMSADPPVHGPTSSDATPCATARASIISRSASSRPVRRAMRAAVRWCRISSIPAPPLP
jgi:hypothetical protein